MEANSPPAIGSLSADAGEFVPVFVGVSERFDLSLQEAVILGQCIRWGKWAESGHGGVERHGLRWFYKRRDDWDLVKSESQVSRALGALSGKGLIEKNSWRAPDGDNATFIRVIWDVLTPRSGRSPRPRSDSARHQSGSTQRAQSARQPNRSAGDAQSSVSDPHAHVRARSSCSERTLRDHLPASEELTNAASAPSKEVALLSDIEIDPSVLADTIVREILSDAQALRESVTRRILDSLTSRGVDSPIAIAHAVISAAESGSLRTAEDRAAVLCWRVEEGVTGTSRVPGANVYNAAMQAARVPEPVRLRAMALIAQLCVDMVANETTVEAIEHNVRRAVVLSSRWDSDDMWRWLASSDADPTIEALHVMPDTPPKRTHKPLRGPLAKPAAWVRPPWYREATTPQQQREAVWEDLERANNSATMEPY